jgi:hypothetical protein
MSKPGQLLWGVKDGLIEEYERKADEMRGINPSYESLQVFAIALKLQRSKGWKDRTCQRSRTSAYSMFGEGAAVSEMMWTNRSLVSIVMHAAIASGEMYPVLE